MFETTVAGSLPKPLWLAEPEKLWPAWKLEGAALTAGKIDATILAVKRQEDAGIDIVSDGEQARIHFVHGFLANLDGIDFDRRQTIGIRADRYKAEVRPWPARSGARAPFISSRRARRAPTQGASSVHPARPDDHRRHDRRRALWQLPHARPRLRRGLERGSARARGARRRRDPARRARLQRLYARRQGLGRRCA